MCLHHFQVFSMNLQCKKQKQETIEWKRCPNFWLVPGFFFVQKFCTIFFHCETTPPLLVKPSVPTAWPSNPQNVRTSRGMWWDLSKETCCACASYLVIQDLQKRRLEGNQLKSSCVLHRQHTLLKCTITAKTSKNQQDKIYHF